MPRGKNYVNNNQGVSMQSSKKKNAPSMEQCFYGKGCTRANCFYRHDGPASGGGEKSAEPCMPFLAGLCTFSAAGCRKRHPNKAEAERLVAKYKQTKCRYGKHCKTDGCLYIHPDSENGGEKLTGTTAFPPLSGTNGAVPRPMAPAGAWKPMQPTGGTAAVNTTVTSAPRGPPAKSAWQPSPPPAPQAAVWGQGINPVLANHSISSVSPPLMNGAGTGMVAPKATPVAANSPATVAYPEPPSPRSSDASMLNINAREFVPGMN